MSRGGDIRVRAHRVVCARAEKGAAGRRSSQKKRVRCALRKPREWSRAEADATGRRRRRRRRTGKRKRRKEGKGDSAAVVSGSRARPRASA